MSRPGNMPFCTEQVRVTEFRRCASWQVMTSEIRSGAALNAMFFEWLARRGQPHNLTLQMSWRANHQVSPVSHRSMAPSAKFGSLDGHHFGSRIGAFCLSSRACSHQASSWSPCLRPRLQAPTDHEGKTREISRRHWNLSLLLRDWMDFPPSGLASVISVCLGMPVASREEAKIDVQVPAQRLGGNERHRKHGSACNSICQVG